MLVSLEMNNKDPAYDYFLTWMAAQSSRTQAGQAPWSSLFRSSTPWMRSHQLGVQTLQEQRKNGSASVMFKLVAAPGTHLLRYNSVWMQVRRERETKAPNLMTGTPWETITVTTLSRDRGIFPQLLSEARDLAMRGQEGKLVINIPWGLEWKPFGQPRRKRPIKSVVLSEGVAEKIEADVQAFLQRRQWYADRGIPYRRGYLLHGPPGSGKSSFIQALAGALNYDICVLNLSERGLADDKLIHLLANTPERSFVLIEDIDAAFNKRVQTSADGYQSSVTFSGFLNALDGVASGEERIIFMTTNHPEVLDPALIRPGRVDLSVLIDDASPKQVRSLFERFYGKDDVAESAGGVVGKERSETKEWDRIPEAILRQLANEIELAVEEEAKAGRRISMAALQGLLIRSNAHEAVRDIGTLFVSRAPTS
ncbi:P-loop containing nucleoside triphosphate hydrolase protein [Epithele typhae]|uniref:P-loop containing nucleoside triphosphate hydrolase protein n=1 Tax=Epithele typhae TaxID=378194 RepID=UPI002008A427|nr:P-loop containing nucleoside triphosphate hydrolase protein [Epithele typhae]KAH9946163.1 P-loop containing nucleoside triphosphate hydrolase protein [Epithele typhae]